MYRVLEATVAYATLICTFYCYYYYYYYYQLFLPTILQTVGAGYGPTTVVTVSF